MMREGYAVLRILNVLMQTDGYLDTQQICYRADCDRKTVYTAVDTLETNGFHIEVVKGAHRGKVNKYKYKGLFGF